MVPSGETQEDLSIVPSSKGDPKKGRKGHMKNQPLPLLEVFVLGQFK
jgi:hypothetical protein